MAQPLSPTRLVRGLHVPAFFYGTAWKEARTSALTRLALDAGFRAVDTANQRRHYVEADVGEAVQAWCTETATARERLFLQTKFTYATGQDHRVPYDPRAPFPVQVATSLRSSLAHLQVTYVDSYLLHGPLRAQGWSRADCEVWDAMQELHAQGLTRLLGVSNVNAAQLRACLEHAEVKPAFVQNRCFAATGWDREVRDVCREHDIAYQAFSLLTANDRELRRPELTAIAQRAGLDLAQLVFRFAVQAGMIPLTGSSSASHLTQDLACFEDRLGDDDLRTMEAVGSAGR